MKITIVKTSSTNKIFIDEQQQSNKDLLNILKGLRNQMMAINNKIKNSHHFSILQQLCMEESLVVKYNEISDEYQLIKSLIQWK